MQLRFDQRLAVSIIPVVVLSTGLVAWLSYRTAANSLIEERSSAMGQHVQRTVRELDSWISERIQVARILGENRRFQNACSGEDREPAQQALIAYKKQWPIYEEIFLADPSGKVFLAATPNAVGMDAGQHPDFRINFEKARANQVWVGEAKKSPVTGRAVSLVTAPIMKDGQLIGILGMPVELAAFADGFISGVKIGRTGYIFVLDSAGVPVVHPDKKLVLDGNFGAQPFVRAMAAAKSGRTEYEDDGRNFFSSFGTFAEKGWLIVALAPEEEVTEVVRPLRTLSLVLALVASVLVGLITWLASARAVRLLRRAVSELTATSEQVASAASRISGSSQELSQGASEQAASLEETSATTEEINSMATRNADNSRLAADAVTNSEGKFVDANLALEQMVAAMGEIKTSSDRISKIIKVIDEIAFQTNILALNAAVEAARAGEAGLGFAVVADEVRNLAQRCATAAKDTASLIEESITHSATGKARVEEVALAIQALTSESTRVKTLVDEVKLGSQEQARGLDQIARTISQMQGVTQTAASSAEESASTSEQLNAQASALQQLVRDLNNLVGAA